MKRIESYSELATELSKSKEIKVSTHYGNDYNSLWVYIPRVYAMQWQKAKVRVLTPNDTVKNCLKITFNPDRYDRKDIERIINSNISLIKRQLHGTCQTHLTCNNLLQILTGVLGRNGLPTEEAKQALTK
jgi:hypothetical protein